jgi:hypothetical protein
MDWIFYLDKYPDLRQNGVYTENQAIQHWKNYGNRENRSPFFYFDWNDYLDIYPDLRKNGIDTEQKAIHHWNNYGKKEGREGCHINIVHTFQNINYTLNDLNTYMKKYDTLDMILVYDFNLENGGIGDCIKFFMKMLYFCMYYNIQIKYQINDIVIENYLRLKYDKMYIKTHNYKKIKPAFFYKVDSYDGIQIPIQELFYFTEEVKNNAKHLLPLDNYISIHLRLGDKYLEIDNNNHLDEREYNETKLYEYIESNIDKKIVFFCDNQNYKQKIKEKYTIFITNASIGHTGIPITSKKQVLDAISEFYLLANSEIIVNASKSGFSIMASKFKNIPILYI